MQRHLVNSLLGFLVILLLAASSSAQPPAPAQDADDEPIKLKTDLITMDAQVTRAKNGEIVALRPVRILGLGLDEAAYNAMMKSWRMRPARDADGNPVAVRVPVEFTFALY